MDSPLTTEKETREFLAAFVRYANPKVVVETGCHHGWTSLAIGEALKDGILYTCDTDESNVAMTIERTVAEPVEVFLGTGVEMIRNIQQPIDMAFLDSGANLQRVEEAKELIPKLAKHGVIFLHDAIQQDDPCYSHIQPLFKNGLFLPFGRGLAVFQKLPY